jgi:hypothetical protein
LVSFSSRKVLVCTIFRVEKLSQTINQHEADSKPEDGGGYVPPKRRFTFNGLYGIISRKTELVINTSVETPYPILTLIFFSTLANICESNSFLRKDTACTRNGLTFSDPGHQSKRKKNNFVFLSPSPSSSSAYVHLLLSPFNSSFNFPSLFTYSPSILIFFSFSLHFSIFSCFYLLNLSSLSPFLFFFSFLMSFPSLPSSYSPHSPSYSLISPPFCLGPHTCIQGPNRLQNVHRYAASLNECIAHALPLLYVDWTRLSATMIVQCPTSLKENTPRGKCYAFSAVIYVQVYAVQLTCLSDSCRALSSEVWGLDTSYSRRMRC